MRKTIILLLLNVFAFLGFAENVVCPHCGKSFEYTKNTETMSLDSISYEVATPSKLNMFQDKYIKNGTFLCIKNMRCIDIYTPKSITLADSSSNVITAAFDESISEPGTDEKLVTLRDSKKKADYYGYLHKWGISFLFVITAIRTVD